MENKEHFVITINRELGSGGCTIGKHLAERLGVKYYDKALVHELTSEFNLTEEELERVKAKKQNWWSDFCQSYNQRYDINLRKDPSPKAVTTEAVFHVESRLLKGLASKESCVVMGRSGFYIFRDTPGALRVLILCNDMQKRVDRVVRRKHLIEEEAKAAIAEVDRTRETYTKRFSGTSRYDARNYDLVINTADMTEEQAADIIIKALG